MCDIVWQILFDCVFSKKDSNVHTFVISAKLVMVCDEIREDCN